MVSGKSLTFDPRQSPATCVRAWGVYDLLPERSAATNHHRIVAQAVELTGDCGFGVKISGFVHPTTFHALGFALLSGSTLSAFCKR